MGMMVSCRRVRVTACCDLGRGSSKVGRVRDGQRLTFSPSLLHQTDPLVHEPSGPIAGRNPRRRAWGLVWRVHPQRPKVRTKHFSLEGHGPSRPARRRGRVPSSMLMLPVPSRARVSLPELDITGLTNPSTALDREPSSRTARDAHHALGPVPRSP